MSWSKGSLPPNRNAEWCSWRTGATVTTTSRRSVQCRTRLHGAVLNRAAIHLAAIHWSSSHRPSRQCPSSRSIWESTTSSSHHRSTITSGRTSIGSIIKQFRISEFAVAIQSVFEASEPRFSIHVRCWVCLAMRWQGPSLRCCVSVEKVACLWLHWPRVQYRDQRTSAMLRSLRLSWDNAKCSTSIPKCLMVS